MNAFYYVSRLYMNHKFKDYLNQLKSIALSNYDLMRAISYARIITYPELAAYNSIDELFLDTDSIILLYETKIHFGHWCCLLKKVNSIEVFDSYGKKPDTQLKNADKLFRIYNNMMIPYLSYLLINSPYEIEYNKDQLQEYKYGIRTCGRWVCERIRNRNINIDEFVEYFNSFKDIGYNPDDVVTILTIDI